MPIFGKSKDMSKVEADAAAAAKDTAAAAEALNLDGVKLTEVEAEFLAKIKALPAESDEDQGKKAAELVNLQEVVAGRLARETAEGEDSANLDTEGVKLSMEERAELEKIEALPESVEKEKGRKAKALAKFKERLSIRVARDKELADKKAKAEEKVEDADEKAAKKRRALLSLEGKPQPEELIEDIEEVLAKVAEHYDANKQVTNSRFNSIRDYLGFALKGLREVIRERNAAKRGITRG